MEYCESKFQKFYKFKGETDHQEGRRQTLLREQKLQRSLIQDESRNLQSVITKCHKSPPNGKRKVRTFHGKYQVDYRLQLSEWLKEKPENINDWFLVPCPKGQRCMVIACNGYTEMYSKAGKLLYTFESLLPGNIGSKNNVTILDCVYVEENFTFYVLDALSYGNQDLMNCEAQFRSFWLKSKFLENDLHEIGPCNQYAFVYLGFYDFENTSAVSIILQRYPFWEDNYPVLDGFLFYHKEASYTFGTTPLVGWLFAFMVPEVLGFPVNPAYIDQKPAAYTDYIHYIVEFDENLLRRKHKPTRNNSHKIRMDEDDSRNENEIEENNDSLKALLQAERNLELEGVFEDITDETQCHKF